MAELPCPSCSALEQAHAQSWSWDLGSCRGQEESDQTSASAQQASHTKGHGGAHFTGPTGAGGSNDWDSALKTK